MIYIIGIFTSLFLSFIILTKKGHNMADLILGIWMIFIGLHLFAYYSYIAKLPYYISLIGFNIPIPFLHGPFLYLYTQALAKPEKFRSKKWMYHFVFPIIVLIIVLPFTFSSDSEKLSVIESSSREYKLFSLLTIIALSLSGFFYIFITNRLLTEHRKRIMNQFSSQAKVNLNWLRSLFYGMAVMWILIIIIGNDRLIFSAASVFIILIGYFGIKQVGIFTNRNFEIPEIEVDTETSGYKKTGQLPAEKRKYAKSGLNEESANLLHEQLKLVMGKEKLYTRSDLTLTDLAARLKIHPNYLSQVINEIEGKNFYDYINFLRVEEFKRLAAFPENYKYTILALAYECGFNSKSVFNRFFKKAFNLSPSEYIKKIRG